MKSRMTTQIHKAGEASSSKVSQPTLASGVRNYRAVRFTLTVLSALFICLLASAPLSHAQNVHVPPPCKALQTELNNLIAERTELQNELKFAAPGEKPSLAGQIKQLNNQITPKQAALNKCAKDNGKSDLKTTFQGTATMTTNNSNLPGPFTQPVSIAALYEAWVHDKIDITNFVPVKVGPFSTPAGSNTTTVTMVDMGSGPVVTSTGQVQITVKLHFHHSLVLAADSDLTITLSTENAGGSRLKSNGAITLVGTSKFDGGYLGGDTCKLVIKGTLLPLP